MASPVQWLLELKDGISGPAKRIKESASGIGGGVRSFVSGIKGAFSALGGFETGIGGVMSGIANFGLSMETFKKGFELFAKGGEAVVKAVEFRQNAKRALEAYEGSAEAAQSSLKFLDQLSNDAGVDTGGLLKFYQALRVTGLTAKETKDILAAGADLSAVYANPEAQATVVDFFKGIKDGKVETDKLFDILPVAKLKAQFSQAKNMSDKAFKDWVKTQNSFVVGDKLLDSIQALNPGKALGQAAEEIKRKSPEAAIQRIKNNITKMLGDDGLLGEKIAGSIDRIGKLFDSSTAEGQAFSKNVGEAINAIVDGLSDPDAIKKFVDAVIDLSKQVGPILKTIGPVFSFVGTTAKAFSTLGENVKYIFSELTGDAPLWFKALAVAVLIPVAPFIALGVVINNIPRAVTYVWGAIKRFVSGLADEFSAAWDSFSGWIDDTVDSVTEFGEDIVDGIKDGITSKWESLKTTLSDLAKDLPGPVKKVLGINSPSKVFMDIAVDTMRGFEVGLDKEAANTNDALEKAINPNVGPIALPVPGGQSGGGGAPVINLTVNVTVAQSGASAEDVASQVSRQVEDSLMRIMERLAGRAA